MSKKHTVSFGTLVLVATGVTALTGVAALTGCGGGNGGGIGGGGGSTIYGPDNVFGAGVQRSYLTTNGGVPVEIGIEMTEAVLANPAALPVPPAGQAAVEIPARVPAEFLSKTPFLSAVMFYSPGHPPVGAQDLPHLHPTWFTIPDSERFQILPGDSRVDVPPAPTDVPTGFIKPPDPVFAFIPTLGNIFFDPSEAGYNEAPFRTSLSEYRYFDGRMTCIALGAPNTFMVAKGSLTRPLGIPARYPKPGYYPTNYGIRFDAVRKTHIMFIGGFVQRS